MSYVVALEGLSSAGKTTFARKLQNRIRRVDGIELITYLHEDLQQGVTISPMLTTADPWTRDLLYAASTISVWHLIQASKAPIVLVDRYIDSLVAYCEGVPAVIRTMIEDLAMAAPYPDLVIFVDTPLPIIEARRLAAGRSYNADREQMLRRRFLAGFARYAAKDVMSLSREDDEEAIYARLEAELIHMQEAKK